VFAAEIDDLGGRRGNTAQALTQCQHPVDSSEARNVLHWAMQPPLYCRILMVIKIASKVVVLFCIVDFGVIHNLRSCYGPYELKLRQIVLYQYSINLFG
jgi:hypothetical protein